VGQLTTQVAWTSGDLLRQMQRRQNLFVLDVRNRDESEPFPLEGSGLTAINVPYFEMLESGGKDDMIDSLVASIDRDLRRELPEDSPILAVCAKGNTSEFVMQALTRLGYNAGTLQGGMKAWGDYYDTQAIVDAGSLSFFQISRPARGCLSYIISSD